MESENQERACESEILIFEMINDWGGEEKDVGWGNSAPSFRVGQWLEPLQSLFIADKYCPIPPSFSVSHINRWCRSSFSHLCLCTTKDGGLARSSCTDSERTLLAACPLGCPSHWNTGFWPDLQPIAAPNSIFCLWEFSSHWVISCCWTDTTADSMHPFILMMQNSALSCCQGSSGICALLTDRWSQKNPELAFRTRPLTPGHAAVSH